MIRHSSSIFLSLAIHTLIIVLAIFTYERVISTKEEIVEKKVRIELCSIVEQKPVVSPKPKPKIEPKPIVEKPKPIIEKPKPAPKPIVKKEIVKEVPVVMPEPVIIEEIVKEETKEIVEEKIIEETFVQTNKKSLETPKDIQKQEVYENKEVVLEREYMQENLGKIVQLLKDNLYYPRRARAMREEGQVMVKFVLSKDATVHSIEVLSSKSKILSRSAIKTIQDLSGDFPKPKEDLTLHVPIEYSLR